MTRINYFTLFLYLWMGCEYSTAQEMRTAVLQAEGYREVIATAQAGGVSTSQDEQSAAQQLNQVAGGTNFIGAEDLKESATGEAALQAQPGVSVRHFVDGQETVNIRGSGVQSIPTIRGFTLLQDGLPMQRSDGSFLIGVMEPRIAQYIKILRGSNGFEEGSATLGGVVDFVSHTGYDASLAQAMVETGSFDHVGSQVSSGQKIDGADYYASFTQDAQTGYRMQSNQSRQTANFNVGYKIAEDLETRFFGTMVQQEFEVPGPLSKFDAENHARRVSRGPPTSVGPNIPQDAPNREIEFYRLANRTTWKDGGNEFSIGSYWLNIDDRIRRTRVRGVSHYNSNDWGGELRYTNTSEIGEDMNRFTTALLPAVGAMQMTTFLNQNGFAGNLIGNHDLYSTQLTYLAENTFYILPELSWILGAQVCYAYREIDEKFSALTSKGSETLDYIGVNPRTGFVYQWDKKNMLFTNVTRSFEPPVFDDLIYTAGAPNSNANPTRFDMFQLAPQTATTLEIGTRGSAEKLSWDITFFHSWVENELLTFQNDAGTVVTENVDCGTIHQGIECGLNFELAKGILDKEDKLELRPIYNWSHFYFDHHSRYGTNAIAAIPEHTLYVFLEYKHPCGFYMGPNVEWMITKTPVDEAHSQFQDPYAVIGFRVGYKTKKSFSVFAEVDNLLDDTYVASVMARDRVTNARLTSFMPGDGLSVRGGVEFKY
ncbi:MAG: TonB-dependent receptor family protein [Verrucomicrobiota bacterium]